MQVSYSTGDILVLVLRRPAFDGEDSAAVNVFEVSVRKLIRSFGLLRLLTVNPQMPLRIFADPPSVPSDEFIFILRRRLVLAPVVPFVVDELPFEGEGFRVLERSFVSVLLPYSVTAG